MNWVNAKNYSFERVGKPAWLAITSNVCKMRGYADHQMNSYQNFSVMESSPTLKILYLQYLMMAIKKLEEA